MSDLILISRGKGRYALQIRDHGPAETEYFDLAVVDAITALSIEAAGAPTWLHPSDRPGSRQETPDA